MTIGEGERADDEFCFPDSLRIKNVVIVCSVLSTCLALHAHE